MDSTPTTYMFNQKISVFSGYLSLFFWLFAQIPQVLENYRNHSVEGIAAGFLASWVAGDVSNLIGCILTDALPFQVLLSSYYCTIDMILCCQYLYYTRLYPTLSQHKSSQRMARLPADDSEGTIALPAPHLSQPVEINTGGGNGKRGHVISLPGSLSGMATGSFLASFGKVRAVPVTSNSGASNSGAVPGYTDSLDQITPGNSSPSSFTVLLNAITSIFSSKITTSSKSIESIGIFFAWVCTALYLAARVPQLYKNYRRRSTEGVSVLLFLCALNGNFFYTVSILTCNEFVHGPQRHVFFIKELPYLLGSAGTILFDVFALYQWRKYRRHSVHVMYDTVEAAASAAVVSTGHEPQPAARARRTPKLSPSAQPVPSKASDSLRGLLEVESPSKYGSLEGDSMFESKPGGTPLTPWDLLDDLK